MPVRQSWSRVQVQAAIARLASAPALLLGSLLVTLGFCVFCTIVLLDARADALRQADEAADNIASALEQDITRNITQFDLSLQTVIQRLLVPELGQLSPELRNMLLFNHMLPQARYLGFINVLDEAGNVIADSQSSPPRPGNYAGRDYFVAQQRDMPAAPYIGRPFEMKPNYDGSIPISRRRSRPDGTFAGVVVASIRLAYFHDLFARLAAGPHGSITLLRTDGTILMRTPFDANDIGRTLPPESAFHVYMHTRVPRIVAVSQRDRIERRYTYRQIDDLPLVLSVGFGTGDIFATWRAKAWDIALLGGALCLANIILAILLRGELRQRAERARELEKKNAQLATLAEQRARAVEAAHLAVAAKTRFLATMSHEMRTPLNSILGYAEMLALDGALDATQAGQVAAMRSAGEHLRDVINNVLDNARSEAQGAQSMAQPMPVRTDLAALVEQCRAQIEPGATAKGLRLACDIEPATPRAIVVDGTRLRQVLINLLQNAVKFTRQGEITLRIGGDASRLRCSVTDTGVGVPPDRRDRLFHEYDRLDAERLGIEGTGLGLAIAARMVADMGGCIGHVDNPAGGAVFWLEVPIGAPSPEPARVRHRDIPPSPPLRVLLVDDSAANRDVASTFLRRAGHAVTEAAGGEEALRLAAAQPFDVVLVDMCMPGMDGAETARRLRALPGARGRMPIVAVTAQVLDGQWAAWAAAGIDAYVAKPYDRAELLTAVVLAATSPRLAGSGCIAMPPPAGEPWPAGVPGAPPLLDAAAVAQIEASLPAERLTAHRTALAADMEALLAMLRTGDGGATRQLPALVHRIAGDAGQLGFMALASAAQQFAMAFGATDDSVGALAAALETAAAQSLAVLRQCLNSLRSANAASTKLA